MVAVAGVLLVAGCSSPAPIAPAPTVPTRTATPSPPPTPQTITVAFGGDVHFEGRVLSLLTDDPATTFGPISRVLRAADLAMVNLETAVTRRGTPEPKEYTFRAPATAFDALTAAGIDVVSLANNHGVDFGQVGLADTLDAAHSAGFPLVGAGVDAGAAHRPWITTVKGIRIAVLGYTQVNTFPSTWVATDSRPGLAYALSNAQIETAADDVRAAREQADVVIVYLHWGGEREPCPRDLQRRTAEELADAGATIVVGAHPHIPQGAGWLDDTYVAYSLGNFLWYSNTSHPDTGVLRVTLTAASVTGVEFLPATIHPTLGQPIPAEGAEADRIRAKVEGLRDCTGLAETRS
jgi:poly-gamma-glutamate synthesis protein (capsule biosynthesis protein)